MTVVYTAWLLLSFAFLGLFVRDRIAELSDRRERAGRSWEPERHVSGRF